MAEVGSLATCDCGCGEQFIVRRKHQKFKNKEHRNNHHNHRLRGVIKLCRKMDREQLEAMEHHARVLLNMKERK
jgi:hypothetical protein